MTSDSTERAPHSRQGADPAEECKRIESDLERLKALIGDAGDRLLLSFNQIAALLPQLAATDEERAQVVESVHAAVTALQFQDMAIQLTEHAQRHLSSLEEQLRSQSVLGPDGTHLHPTHPVRQFGMAAGSIDLF